MNKSTFSRWLMVALGLAALALLAGGTWFYRAQKRALHREAEADLTTIAQLKVDQIDQWRTERLADAAVIADSPFFTEAVARWLVAPQAEDTEQLLTRFRSLQAHHHYSDILLVDASGKVHLSLSGYVGQLHEDAAQTLAVALTARQPTLSDLHAGPGDLPPHVDAIAPISTGNSPTSEPVGAIVLQRDAQQFLYPLIQSWPVPSDSAETLLVRRDGDQVLFLNDLRFQPGAAFTLRFPLSQSDLPAVMAVLGQEGLVQGVDYRGVEVLAVLKAVPDSPWYMVAKVDAAEALSAVRREATLILALLLGLVLTAAVGGAAVWQRNAAAHYRALFRAEQRHYTTLLSVGDGVIVVGTDGRVELLNPVAEALTGWSQAEARGKPLTEAFHIVNEETHQPEEDPVSRVLREGRVVGLANHTLLIARDGTERPVADSGAPIRSEQGEIDGVVLVFRDQTGEREAQRALQNSEEKFKYVFEAANVGKSLTLPTGEITVNRAFADMLGYTREELKNKTWQELTLSDDIELSQRMVDLLLNGGQDATRFTKRFLHKNGSQIWTDVSSTIRRDGEGKPLHFITTIVDITERKQAEEALRESEERFKSLFENVLIGLYRTTPDGHILMANPALVRLLGLPSFEELAGRNLEESGFEPGYPRLHFKEMIERQGYVVDFESAWTRKDGSTLFVRESARAVCDEQGKILYYEGTAEDITERKRAEEALLESEKLLREIATSYPNSYLSIVERDLTIGFTSGQEFKKQGVNPESFVGLTLEQVFGEHAPTVREHYLKAFDGAETEFELFFNDQYQFYRVVPLADDSGRVERILAVVENITERKQAEEALRESEEKYRLLIDNMHAGVVVHAPDTSIILNNRRACELLGLTEDQMLGKTAIDPTWCFVHEDKTTMPLEEYPVNQVISGLKPIENLVVGINHLTTNDHVWVLANAYPVFDVEKELAHVTVIFVDITERKLAKDALQQRASQLTLLNEIGSQVTALLDVAQVLDRAAHLVQKRFDYHHVGLFTWADGQNRLVMRARAGEFASLYPPDHSVALGQGMVGWVGQHGETLLANDVEAEPHYVNPYPDRLPTRAELSVPVRIGDEILGVLDVQSPQPNDFDPDDVTTLETLAGQLAVAIHNARLFQETQQQLDELGLLFTASVTFSISLDLDTVLETTARQITAALNAEGCAISFWDREQDALVTMLDYSPNPVLWEPDPPGTSFPLADYPLSRRVIVDRQPAVVQVDDAGADPAEAAWMAAQEVKSMLMVPLVALDQVIGLLELMEMYGPRSFSPAELRLVQTLANQTAAALENARLYDEARRRSRELGLLNQVIAATAAAGEALEPVLETVCRELALAFDVPQAAAALFNEAKTEAVVVAEYLAPGRPPSLGERIPAAGNLASQHLLTHKTPLVIEDAQTDPRQASIHDLMRQRGTVSLLLLPLVVDGEVLGSLGVDALEPRRFSDTDVSLASRVAEQVSGVLARVHLEEERRKIEEQFLQAQKMEAVGRLAGGVAHDFNNLLTVIHLSTRLLEKQVHAWDPLWPHVQRIREAGQRATNLTRQLLAFSRRQIVEPQVVDLNQVLAELDKMLRRLIGEDVDLTTRLTNVLWPVKVDPTQVEQVVVNLAVNARDAMPSGGKLTIETANVTLDAAYAAHHLDVEPGEYAMLAVSDTGTGMSDEVKARLFEPFFTTKEKGKGTGLGLATVFGIVKQNKGHIWVYSEPGKGTTFKIYLPRVAEGIQPASDLPTSSTTPPVRGSETLLLVEDEPGVRELVADILIAQGYQVLAAEDGVAALEVAQDHGGPIHLLLTDVVMPRLSGKALADQLWSSRPEMQVLFTSGYTDNSIAHHGVLDEGVHFLSKPFELEALARKVRAVLDDARQT